ncbi:MAG TPA: PaaI family thioesterase [Xanthomonadales bacterium]|nr:PaaI family thioesterase [Xanthomonadales bacterium]
MSVQNPARRFGVVPPEQALKMSGIEFLSAMREGHLPGAPISETLDFWMQSCEVGRVVFEARPSGRFYNPMGMVHGGWMATLLDTVMGCAVHSTLKAGQTYTTLTMQTGFLRAVHENTGIIRCEGLIIHAGSRTATATGQLFDGKGRLVAYGSESCLILNPV